MRAFRDLGYSGMFPLLSDRPVAGRSPSDQTERRPMSWPLAVVVIAGLSVGCWVLVYRALQYLFGF